MIPKKAAIRLFPKSLISAGALLLPCTAPAGELEDYIKKEDGALAYKIQGEANLYGVRAISIRLTSQEWQGMKWTHWLSVLIPPEVDKHRKGLLVVSGGSSKSKAPDARSREAFVLASTALALKVPIALLGQVPNQPLFENLREDDLIAHTFKNYLDGGGNDWPLLLPMVKSATRAMDALQQMTREGKLKSLGGAAIGLDQFIVTGASKRGWTTWLTGAVDSKRVCAIAPMVIDVLNMQEQMNRQQKTYGQFSDMIKPYTKRGIQKRNETKEGKRLNQIVDPFAYRSQILQPKLVLLGTNDPYWTADSSELYFNDLLGPKSLFNLPNAGHGLGAAVLPTLNAFISAQLDQKDFPQLQHEHDGEELSVSWKGKGEATLWKAISPNRDFRKAQWTSTKLEGESSCKATVTVPKQGWLAYYVSVTFPPVRKGDAAPTISTPIHVTPDRFPHKLPVKTR